MSKGLGCGCNGKICIVPEHFIGSVFSTPKGGLLTVTGLSDRRTSGGSKYYTVDCSICSKDTELFPNGFEIPKRPLKKGTAPCGCSKTPHWSKEQYKILVKRECIKRGNIKSHVFIGGDWHKKKTRVKLECLKDGNTWDISINNLLNTTSGCPKCMAIGVGDRFRPPQKEVDAIIKEICKEEGLEFISWVDGYINAQSKFNWTCANGHKCQTTVSNFTGKQANRCRTCAYENTSLGFYPEKAEDQDTLYLLKFTGVGLDGLLEIFIKIGRTFDFDRRMEEFKKSSYQVEKLAIEHGQHKATWPLEQYYHCLGKSHNYKYVPSIGFGGSARECFTMDVLDLITINP